MPAARLSPTSYLLLGLIAAHGPCTSYELKSLIVEQLAGLVTVPHSQLYQEPDRLVEHGLLDRHTETEGRRRKLFRVTPVGSAALTTWLVDEDPAGWEVRDTHVLRLGLLGALGRHDLVAPLAKHRWERHEQRVAELEARPDDELSTRYALALETAARDFWAALADG